MLHYYCNSSKESTRDFPEIYSENPVGSCVRFCLVNSPRIFFRNPKILENPLFEGMYHVFHQWYIWFVWEYQSNLFSFLGISTNFFLKKSISIFLDKFSLWSFLRVSLENNLFKFFKVSRIKSWGNCIWNFVNKLVTKLRSM